MKVYTGKQVVLVSRRTSHNSSSGAITHHSIWKTATASTTSAVSLPCWRTISAHCPTLSLPLICMNSSLLRQPSKMKTSRPPLSKILLRGYLRNTITLLAHLCSICIGTFSQFPRLILAKRSAGCSSVRNGTLWTRATSEWSSDVSDILLIFSSLRAFFKII